MLQIYEKKNFSNLRCCLQLYVNMKEETRDVLQIVLLNHRVTRYRVEYYVK